MFLHVRLAQHARLSTQTITQKRQCNAFDSIDMNRRQIWLVELSRVLGCNLEALLCPSWLPYHLSLSFSSTFFFSSCIHVIRFTHFRSWCGWTLSYVYILNNNICLLFIIKCYLLCIKVYFSLIILCLILWFELSLTNTFELRNREEQTQRVGVVV